MRPAPIDDKQIWKGGQRLVVSPPDGDPTNPSIAPVEAIADRTEAGALRLSVRCVLEPGDLAKLRKGGEVWLSFLGHMVPFSVMVVGPEGE